MRRSILMVALLCLSLFACGGGTEQGADADSGQSEATTGDASNQTTSANGGSEGNSESSSAGSADNSISYSISGGYDAGGDHPFIPSMSYFDNGIWTMTFGDEGGALLIVNLDPSTPSVNFTNGTATAAGDSTQCVFDVTRQDASGATGSFTCSDVPVVDSGVLTQADDFRGSFDANP